MPKKVTFSPETTDPSLTEQCKNCRHRNVTPRIRKMGKCRECARSFCHRCLVGTNLCRSCILRFEYDSLDRLRQSVKILFDTRRSDLNLTFYDLPAIFNIDLNHSEVDFSIVN